MGVWPAKGGGFNEQGGGNARVWCAVAGNGETAVWDLETAGRLHALWPNETAPLSYQKVLLQVLCYFLCFRAIYKALGCTLRLDPEEQ